jgi:predicted TIM-barrel fold metal-dependent hydrolase
MMKLHKELLPNIDARHASRHCRGRFGRGRQITRRVHGFAVPARPMRLAGRAHQHAYSSRLGSDPGVLVCRKRFAMGLDRHAPIGGATASSVGATGDRSPTGRRIFDSHCHIIDHRFPIVANQGYTPPDFPLEAYVARARPLGVMAGAIVSGSFQATDQSYLMDALPRLGAGWVGVTQIPPDFPDAEIAKLAALGVRAVRFNLFRGRIDSVDDIVAMANRVYSVAGWHAEMYVDAAALRPHVDRLSKLPQLCIDHLGMTEAGVPVLLDLVAAGCKVKATGFGRVKLDVPATLEAVAKADPSALVFGTDIPSTRAERPFESSDIDLVERVLGPELARKAFWDNPIALYTKQRHV